jgi:two-component system cell cycle sensor histidine kinase/response regulator CckA
MATQGEGAGASKPVEIYAWLQALFDESPMAIGFSRDGVMLDANAAYVSLLGYGSVAELRGRSILEQIAPSHRARIDEMVAQRARGQGPPHRYQSRGLRKDGSEFPFEITTTRVVVPDGPLTIAFITDLSERDAALEALRASEERFRTLSAGAFEGVFLHADGKIVLANETGAAMYGFDAASIIGVSLRELTAPESHELVADHVRRGTTAPYEGVARRKDGSTFVAEVLGRTLLHQGRPTRVTIIRDVTERRRLEGEQRALAERMRQGQKLESLGVLAGGVAHDFNNILTVIANGVALAKREGGLGPAAAHLDAIALAAERAADLCRQMLAYAGKAALVREAVDLSAIVAEMSSMLEISVAKKATLVRELAPALPSFLGDATQIRQIAMNLVLNASEAIGATRGTVRVSTGMGTYAAEAFARSPAGGEPKGGAYVYLEVRDDGVGMDEATVAQMFDPFFTTKFVGRGLGMAAVLGIVRGHAGAIDVETAPGVGTRIRIYFPVSAAAHPIASARPAAEELKGEGLVLVVDDEKNVRISTQLLLQEFGFEVIVARDGVEAIALFEAQSGRIGAVLLDLTMPRMDGLETLKELRRIAPGVPVVLTSGYGATPPGLSEIGAEPGVAPDAVLAKPYAAAQLVGTLQQVMRAAR